MIKRCTIFGERQTGTNYLENVMSINFDVDVHFEYGWKHWPNNKKSNYENSDDTLFICIVRNPVDWINSFYRKPHHVEHIKRKGIDAFLNSEFYSLHNDGSEIMGDRNLYTGEKYKNIFELRHTKLQWMIEDLPNMVNNYIFIKYEELINDFDSTLDKIRNKGLKIKDNIDFPQNFNLEPKTGKKYIKIENTIPSDTILGNRNLILQYEEQLYNISSVDIKSARRVYLANKLKVTPKKPKDILRKAFIKYKITKYTHLDKLY